MSTKIPQPRTVPFLGNAYLIESDVPLKSFMLLAKEYGPIFQLSFPGRTSIFVSGLDLVDELCDQKRFHKSVKGSLKEVRHLTGDGLFSAYHGEKNWGIAHRILMPAFGPAKIRDMFGQMTDICDQLIKKWERFGPEYVIDPSEDFTRLTFDTIALCAMSYRLNSFYSSEMVPFITAMGSFLVESGRRSMRPSLVQNYLVRSANAQYEADMKLMMDLTHEIIKKRKQSSVAIDDLLGLMLTAKDEVTGEGLSDETIAYNLVTFLIAGHETTSGLLSFTLYHLLKNPSAYAKVRAEVDEVLGKEPIRPEHLSKLPYITAVLRETLRITPSVPIFTLEAFEDTTMGTGDKTYRIPKDAALHVLVSQLHMDTDVWGEDVGVFRPERMLDGGFERAPKNAWKPFGNGVRSCIGRPLAWQEALIVVASVFQKFDFVLDNPSYELRLKSTLTIKPTDFHIRAIPREGAPFSMHSHGAEAKPADSKLAARSEIAHGPPLYLAYGSNSGTCKDFAQRIAKEAPSKGFQAHVNTLNFIGAKIPTDGPLIVLTASYEGEPADNAGLFVEALKHLKNGELANVRFAVFGCGHHDWVQTYQKIPTLVDELLSKAGGQRLMKRTAADSGSDEFFDTFEDWVPNLWGVLDQTYGDRISDKKVVEETVTVEVTGVTRATILKHEETGALGTVVENRLLTAPGAPSKRHIEIALPPDVTYNAGDYLSILPSNPIESVRRVLTRFGLLADQQIIIKSGSPTTLPTDVPISVSEVLTGYVEISQPATRKNVQDLIKLSPPETAKKLEDLAADLKMRVSEKHLSVLDILESFPEINISLATFLQFLPAMRIRQYSISSSSLWRADHVTLTISVLEAPAESGRPGKFIGVASNYLASLRAGHRVHVGVRSSAAAFHLPADPKVPVVMFAAGSGIAPMRGFIQERAMQHASGRDVGKTILFYGCRAPEEDYLYANDDLKAWIEAGIVEVRPTFSRAVGKSEGLKYVQDRVWHDRDDIDELYKDGARFYTCGSPGVARGMKEVILNMLRFRGVPDPDSAFERIQSERLATDVFA